MTERLAEVSARIEGIRQLGSVVNAMKGIAAARARTARAQLGAVDSHAATIAAALSNAIGPAGQPAAPACGQGRTGLLVFAAEQGFAGAFSERVLDSIADALPGASLFLVGTRGLSVARSRGLSPAWSAPMASHPPAVPKLADRIARAIYHALDAGQFDRLEVVHTRWTRGQPCVHRQALLPLDPADLPPPETVPPLTQLPRAELINSLTGDYLHALICRAALHAFAAENEARMQAMASADSQITRELATFEATLRRVRQEAITAEIIELGTGVISVAHRRQRR